MGIIEWIESLNETGDADIVVAIIDKSDATTDVRISGTTDLTLAELGTMLQFFPKNVVTVVAVFHTEGV